ncbi:MAG: zinc-binding dehydrogenase [Gammaproteobacteria bacterium]
MKAIVLRETSGSKGLSLDEVDLPQPCSGEARVRLMASALNRRDVWMTRGLYPRMQLPCIPGSDGAGIVDAVGPDVDGSLSGREVIIYPAMDWGGDERCAGPDFRILGMPDPGTFAEYICVPAENLRPRPAHLSWEQAAAIPLAGLTSWRAAVTQGEVAPGQKVLVTGAGGGVAGFVVMWCARMGADVFVTSSSEDKIAMARGLGAVAGEDYRSEDCYKNLKRQSGGFDLIIDSAGGRELNPLLDILGPGGRYVFYGATLGNPDTGLSMAKLFFRQNRLQGTTMGSPAEFSAMVDFVNREKIDPVIDRVFPLSEAAQAHEYMEAQKHTGKILLRNSDD